MPIVHQSALFSSTLPPVLLLPSPPKRLALPAPRIAGYLSAPLQIAVTPVRRVVEVEIVNPLILIDIRKDPEGFWAEFERIHGRIKTIEEMDAEIEAKHPGYLAWVASREQMKAARS